MHIQEKRAWFILIVGLATALASDWSGGLRAERKKPLIASFAGFAIFGLSASLL